MSQRFLLSAGLMAALLAGQAMAGDEDALNLADQVTPSASPERRDWRLSAEGMGGHEEGSGAQYRTSLDGSWDATLAPGWRAVLADRLDVIWQGDTRAAKVNTLKEAYISWQPDAALAFDLGRLNPRQGVAMGYNPTDFFKAGAIRQVVSIDPASLRDNRLGVGMLRAQTLWQGGSLSGIYAPKLGDGPSGAPFSADFGASNPQNRWQLAVSEQFAENFNPQLLTYGGDGLPTLFGANLSVLLGDALIVYGEYAGGRQQSQLAMAGLAADDTAYRSRLAAGASYTLPLNLTLTLEYQYDGAAPDQTQWQALQGNGQHYGQYRQWQLNAQELATRQALFSYASWTDAFIKHLDLSAMQRHDLADASNLYWLEARYHFSKVDLAFNWQQGYGCAMSTYGPLAQSWQVLVKYFF